MNKSSELSAVTKECIRGDSHTVHSPLFLAGIVAVLLRDIQAFFNFWTLQGEKFLDGHAGSVGLRVDF